MVKRGEFSILVLLVLASIPFVLAQPSDCHGTNLPSYKQYLDPNVARAWDTYSVQSAGVCVLEQRRPKGGECRFTFEVRGDTGPSHFLCWYGEGKKEVTAGDMPGLCKGVYLKSFKEYSLPEVQKLWDSYSLQSEGVCRIDRPAMPEVGDCKFEYELTTPEHGVQAVLCWYIKAKTVAQPAEIKAPVPESQIVKQHLKEDKYAAKPGFFSRIKSWWTDFFKKDLLPFTKADALSMFVDQIIRRSELPEGTIALMYPKELPAGTEVKDWEYNSVTFNEPGYFAWIDPTPDIAYAHPTVYSFLFSDRQVKVYTGGAFALVNGEDIRNVGESIMGGSGPTGGVTGLQTSNINGGETLTGEPLTHHPNDVAPTALGTENEESKERVSEEECPPGYVKRELANPDESGFGFAVVAADANINFAGEADNFLSALTSAGWVSGGQAKTISEVQSAIRAAASAPEASSFAMLISSHGTRLWKVTLKNRVTGEEKTLNNFPSIDPTKDALGIPSDYAVVSAQPVNWCFQIGNTCAAFNSNQLANLKSCRKFLVSSACYSGALTEHNVEGLSVYSGSQADRPGFVTNKNIVFGKAFTDALLANPPKDPVEPWNDEPKPEFDAAFNAGAGAVSGHPAQGRRLVIPLGQGRTGIWVYDQKAVEHSVPPKKECQKAFECVPAPSDKPLATPTGSDCQQLKEGSKSIPDTVDAILFEGENYKYDRLTVMAGMIRDLESLKNCYKCPPGQTAKWDGCEPYGSAIEAIDAIISGLKIIARGNFDVSFPEMTVSVIEQTVKTITKCKLTCFAAAQPRTPGDIIPGEPTIPTAKRSCPDISSSLYNDGAVCRRACGECRQTTAGAFDIYTARKLGISEKMRCYECLYSSGSSEPGGSPSDWTFDCNAECAKRGMSTQQPSSQSVLQKLQQYRCVTSAEIQLQSLTIGGTCVCYPGDVKIVIDNARPYCDTPCGKVACDRSATCPSPDKPNFQVTAKCTWGGWQEIGKFAYRPVIGGAS